MTVDGAVFFLSCSSLLMSQYGHSRWLVNPSGRYCAFGSSTRALSTTSLGGGSLKRSHRTWPFRDRHRALFAFFVQNWASVVTVKE